MKWILSFFVSVLTLSCFAQSTTSKIKVLGAYYTERLPGIIPVDEDRKPRQQTRDTTFVIYVETAQKNINWGYIWKGNKAFSAIPTRIDEVPYEVGKTKRSQRLIKLAPSNGRQLWQLELAPYAKDMKSPRGAKGNALLIKGKLNKKPFTITVNKLTELYTPPSV